MYISIYSDIYIIIFITLCIYIYIHIYICYTRIYLHVSSNLNRHFLCLAVSAFLVRFCGRPGGGRISADLATARCAHGRAVGGVVLGRRSSFCSFFLFKVAKDLFLDMSV
jgi:hypothetical protein